jgi:hypothetical protein
MILVFFCVIALVLVIAHITDESNKSKLKALSDELGGELRTTGSFTIMSSGNRVTFSRTRRAYGKSSVPWTEIDVEIPRVYPLAMFVRKQRHSDEAPIERGETIDVVLGDDRFDKEFLVEAAPEAVIKKLIDLKVMGFLLEQQQVELMTKTRNGAKVIQLSLRGWLEGTTAVNEAIEIVVGMASRMRDAYSEAVQEVPIEQIGAPFRPEPDDHAQRLVEASHRGEVEHIEVLHEKRLSNERQAAFAIAVLFIAILFAVVIATASR